MITPDNYLEVGKNTLQNQLNIQEPPCKGCKNFTPRSTTDNKGNFNGIALCSADNMYRDFSCFKVRGGK
jgi:hypothetical protein